MDAYEATQLVFARVQAQDPENVSKIMGLLLLQDRGEQEMARLALGSDALLQSAIAKARRELGLGSTIQILHSQNRASASVSAGVATINRPTPLFIPDHARSSSSSPGFFHPEEFEANHWVLDHHQQARGAVSGLANAHRRHLQQIAMGSGAAQIHHSSQDLAAALACKPCLYFSRGYCKHGESCRFLHGSSSAAASGNNGCAISSPSGVCNGHCAAGSASFSPMDDRQQHSHGLGSPASSTNSSSSSSSSLEALEIEIQELLRGRRTPVSIASLPQLYFERFGKALQAQGYLTESQRHGKAGCSLTKLLARLKGSVTLIDRPHGQHAVVLAEDAQRFIGYRADRDDLKDANPSSRQIYLTFPAESTFTEEDVSAHFRAYGPVQDVRIPYQQKRMFGFVTFMYPETVKSILSEGNPHYICGARVLVKPYREKAKINERKQADKLDPIRAQFRGLGGKDFMQDASFYDVLARRLEEEKFLELERRRMLEFQRLDSLRAQAAEMEAAKLLLLDEHQLNGGSLLNGVHVSVDSPEVPGTPQIMEHNKADSSSSSSSHGTGINDVSLTLEDMQQSSNPFRFVMDVLEGETGDETEGLPPVINSTDANKDNEKNLVKSNGLNLPESPFASSPNDNEVANSGISEQQHDVPSFSLQERMMGLNLNEVLSMSSPPPSDVVCCICLKHCVEPSTLECSHTFCVQCILKVIRGSKDECPICRQHIGSQVYKILRNRDLQSWLSPTLSHRVAQHIW